MTPEDFAVALKNLPADTAITAEHILAILSVLKPNAKVESNYSQWDSEKLIDQKILADWIGESESTIEKWRKKAEGPIITYKNKKVAYMVKDVRDWLYGNQYASPAEHRQAKQKELLDSMGLRAFAGMEFDTVFSTIYVDDKPVPFFESIYEENNITGYETLWAEKNSLASWFLSVLELDIDIDTIISELESKVNDGLDINSTQSFIKNNQLYTENFGHIVARQQTKSFEDYKLLVSALFNLGLDFTQQNSDGLTAIDLAKQNNNENLIRMINSKTLFEKLNTTLP